MLENQRQRVRDSHSPAEIVATINHEPRLIQLLVVTIMETKIVNTSSAIRIVDHQETTLLCLTTGPIISP